MANRLVLLSLGGVLLLSLAASAETVDVRLEYRKQPEERQEFYPYGGAYTRALLECPAGDWKLPELNSEKPLYGLVELGETRFLLVIDRSDADAPFYDRIWFDENGNQDLTDDPWLDGESLTFDNGQFRLVTFAERADVEYLLGGQSLLYSLEFGLQGQNLDTFDEEALDENGVMMHVMLNVQTNCCYCGTFDLDGRAYRLMLGDSNCDGSFTDRMRVDEDVDYPGRFPLYAEGDTLYLTTNEKFDYSDGFTLGNRLLVGEQLFEVAVDVAAGRLSLTPSTGERLPLELAYAPERLLAHTRGFELGVMMLHPGKVVRLPAGDYRLLSYQIQGTGEQGDVWTLEACATKDTAYVTLQGAGARLAFGEPFRPLAEVPAWYLQQDSGGEGGDYPLDFNVVGCAGELLTDLSRVSGGESAVVMSAKNRNRPAEPTYTIFTSTGEKVAAGSFEYG